MVLTLLRHAALPAAYHGRFIGHTDIAIDPALFDAAKTASLRGMQYDRVYASDLVRCTGTLERMGIDAFITDPRLREVRFKPEIEGKSFAEIEAMADFDPRLLDSRESWHRHICDEPQEQFRERIARFLETLPEAETILICSHGGTLGMMASLLEPHITHPVLGYLDHLVINVRM